MQPSLSPPLPLHSRDSLGSLPSRSSSTSSPPPYDHQFGGPPIGLTLDTRSDGLLSTTRWVFVIIPTRSLFWLSGLKYLFQLYFVSEALTIAPVICGLNSSREMKIAFYFPLLYNL